MKYQIIITDKVNEQINDIIMYIADESKSKEGALNFLGRLEEEILKLEDFPFMGVKPKYLILKKQGYLVLVFEKYLIFYKVNQERKKVIIYAIFNSKQEYRRLI